MSETCRGCGREYDCAPDCLFQRAVDLQREVERLEARLKRAFEERDEALEELSRVKMKKGGDALQVGKP